MIELRLTGIEVDCIIGDRPDERCRTQRLIVDIVLVVDTKADYTDELSDTVDYAALADLIRAKLVDAQCKMVECAARLAYDVCRADAKVVSADVTVTKANAVPGLRSASARICS